ncbi:MAG: hypothetical protein AB3N14_00080 [Flavobacteriaceae bacterium]
MKNLIVSVCFVFLSSCYSYRGTQETHNELIIGKKYKVELSDKTVKKGKILMKSVHGFTLRSASGKTFDITYSEIVRIKKAKFSVLKTAGIPAGVIGGLWAVFLISDPISINLDGLQFPN